MSTWFNESLNAAGDGGLDLPAACTADELYVAFMSGVTPDTADGGHAFMQDLLDAGGTVETEAQLTGCSWTARQLTGPASVTIPDPGGGTTATWAVLYRKTGNNVTSRLLSAEDITDLTFDSENDTLNIDSPILQIGN